MTHDEQGKSDLQDLIQRERNGVEPPPGTAERGWRALQANVHRSPVDPRTDLAPGDVARAMTAAPTATWIFVSLVVVACAVGVWFVSRPAVVLVPSEPQLVLASPGLDDEIELLGRAQVALEADRPGDAGRFLLSFRRRHAVPLLGEEAAALEARTACAAKQEEASQLAREFVRLHPRSPYAERVKSDCGLSD